MKEILVLTIFLIAAVSTQSGDKYTSRYDNVDIDSILRSDRLLRNYVNCALDKGPCTPEGAELKKNLPDGLQNGCAKCTPRQRELGNKVIKSLHKNHPDWFKALEEKYDPQGIYRQKYGDRLEKILHDD